MSPTLRFGYQGIGPQRCNRFEAACADWFQRLRDVQDGITIDQWLAWSTVSKLPALFELDKAVESLQAGCQLSKAHSELLKQAQSCSRLDPLRHAQAGCEWVPFAQWCMRG